MEGSRHLMTVGTVGTEPLPQGQKEVSGLANLAFGGMGGGWLEGVLDWGREGGTV